LVKILKNSEKVDYKKIKKQNNIFLKVSLPLGS